MLNEKMSSLLGRETCNERLVSIIYTKHCEFSILSKWAKNMARQLKINPDVLYI
jgi:hypothetical protein